MSFKGRCRSNLRAVSFKPLNCLFQIGLFLSYYGAHCIFTASKPVLRGHSYILLSDLLETACYHLQLCQVSQACNEVDTSYLKKRDEAAANQPWLSCHIQKLR